MPLGVCAGDSLLAANLPLLQGLRRKEFNDADDVNWVNCVTGRAVYALCRGAAAPLPWSRTRWGDDR